MRVVTDKNGMLEMTIIKVIFLTNVENWPTGAAPVTTHNLGLQKVYQFWATLHVRQLQSKKAIQCCYPLYCLFGVFSCTVGYAVTRRMKGSVQLSCTVVRVANNQQTISDGGGGHCCVSSCIGMHALMLLLPMCMVIN